MKTENKTPGCGLGHYTDPIRSGGLSHKTTTPNKNGRKVKSDKRQKQKGWDD